MPPSWHKPRRLAGWVEVPSSKAVLSSKHMAIIEAAGGVRIVAGGIVIFAAADPSIVGDATATMMGPTMADQTWS